ncbi:type II toxin-antitoxin system VapC family toxin [Caulobacter segnis]|uniref:type II toxin-antitoxin system VapC family toxin n=1 Tax=Caulobacter segnis TaxID=88688 RepID=UPI00240F0E0C|nr:type II toxin-antitoxin system VapC family toxin [Caulobacter segnis]MDG2520393.1 type II toxin-antitoxin system VapC family toxin [Caulobacter segnis]
MIVVDTSALMALLLNEPEADRCAATLEAEPDLLISAGTTAEAFIVASRRDLGAEMESLIRGLGFEIVDVTAACAARIAQVYARWGKGAHPAALNFGDCFAYDLAKQRGCGLLYVGDDFARTDIVSVLRP